MRKLIVAASIVLLAACASPQKEEQISINPQPTLSNQKMVDNVTFTLSSKDLRTAQYVALVKSGRKSTQPIHARQNLRVAIETALYEQLISQGFQMVVNSNNTLTLEVQQVLVNVANTLMENEMDAVVTLQLTAETPQGKFVKTYNGTGKKTGTMAASDEEIATVLNDVINLTLAEIANDQELSDYMKERF
ncbi:YajG family lipoprotein [Vibrio tapetis]|uniref:Putative Lipoprotein_16 super family n=1 Tax=Vibrio tapetis subsp. tapetis TaxID=1671868 RepID=A0A2N8ZC42_9VIBR|nr:YajG family lipoprotein [Vibrio tapetis]MDN3681389.1 YajG family lipoprotein [Vibrio tapetis subsp. quintayensis]SON49469.1 putative Lipoprotein_16 super family [Vibrio tapetis subsp. tapetis]